MLYSKLMDKIEELLTRAVDKIYPSKEALEDILRSGKKLRLYQGFDPTGTQLHIGHMVGLRKLRQWQDMGHHVIFLIGDFTATVGDPTGKDKTRPRLSKERVINNAKKYKEQASKLLRFKGENPIEIKYNSEWLEKMSGEEFMHLTSLVSYNQIIERDMFQKRLKKNESIGVLEMIYPVLQAYDSVAMNIDLELGGTDQTFNMLMGRNLVKAMQKREKFVMTTPLLTDAKGAKIGKTEDNVIALTDKPLDLFAKIMALGDDVIVKGLEYLTDLPMEKIQQISKDLKSRKNPVGYKKMLAFEIVKQLNSHEESHKAQEDFEKIVQNKTQSEKISIVNYKLKTPLSKIAINEGLAASNSEWKRLISQNGIKVNGETLRDPDGVLLDEITLQRGRKSVKITPS